MNNLGYEQLIALQIMHDSPNKEGSDIAKKADCSWNELYSLAQSGLIDLGFDRLKPNQVHPIITDTGLTTLKQAENEEII